MFSGIIEDVGRIVEVVTRSGSKRMAVASRLPMGEVAEGESIAVSGACLTVTAIRGDRFFADVVAETLARTTLGSARPGTRVNLERSLRLADRLSGHLVQGHVDAVAPVREVRRRGDDFRLRVSLPAALRRYVAEKGSIALHGVSLTVSSLTADGFEVALVPETVARTTLGGAKAGERLNVEVDLVARYLEGLAGRSEDPTAAAGAWTQESAVE